MGPNLRGMMAFSGPDDYSHARAFTLSAAPDPGVGRETRERVLIVTSAGVAPVWPSELSRSGFSMELVRGAEAGLTRAQQSGVALIVVDIEEAAGASIDFVRTLRDEGNPATILVAIDTGDTETVVELLESGADGCMDRTSSGRELVARLQALLRRQQPGTHPGSVSWVIDDLRVDPRARSVFRDAKQIFLARRESAVLLALLRRRGRAVSRDEVLKDVWRHPPRPTLHAVDTIVRDLRRKLEVDASKPQYILTVRSAGYMIR